MSQGPGGVGRSPCLLTGSGRVTWARRWALLPCLLGRAQHLQHGFPGAQDGPRRSLDSRALSPGAPGGGGTGLPAGVWRAPSSAAGVCREPILSAAGVWRAPSSAAGVCREPPQPVGCGGPPCQPRPGRLCVETAWHFNHCVSQAALSALFVCSWCQVIKGNTIN